MITDATYIDDDEKPPAPGDHAVQRVVVAVLPRRHAWLLGPHMPSFYCIFPLMNNETNEGRINLMRRRGSVTASA